MLAGAQEAFKRGDYEAAEKAVLKVIADSPRLPEAYVLLGMAYGNQKKYSEAVKLFEKAIKLDPDNPEANNNLGVVYRQMGKLSQRDRKSVV